MNGMIKMLQVNICKCRYQKYQYVIITLTDTLKVLFNLIFDC